ncbi:MAG: pseudouridine synthase [Christensenellales bacterium]
MSNGEVERKAATGRRKAACGSLLVVPEAQPVDIVPQDIPLDILSIRMQTLLSFNKKERHGRPSRRRNESGTLVNAVALSRPRFIRHRRRNAPGIVHRLDKDTSGLILIAKNDAAHASLSEQFKARTMEKHYRAIAHGSFSKDEGMIDAPIGPPSD